MSTNATLLGPPTGSADQATRYLITPRAGAEYTAGDVQKIVAAYATLGDQVGLDWFLALAQMAHETGAMTSWWCQRPRRNPAGIGVTGNMSANAHDQPPGSGWTWDDRTGFWREGWSFPSWKDGAIPAHLGRLLAYALPGGRGTEVQRNLIAVALTYRPLPATYRGAAVLWTGLNGRWASPGRTYGQRVMAVAQAMRKA